MGCPVKNAQFSPEEISAHVLRKVVKDAATELGKEIKKAVITVPAYFNDSQRQATKDAGQIAGLDVLRIVNEPTAAAMGFGFQKNDDEVIVIYDLGGGTFDVSVLEVGDGIFEVLTTNGDTHLGGDNFDEQVIQWVVKDFRDKEGIDLTEDSGALQRVTEAAEKVKVELSSVNESRVYLPFIAKKNDSARHVETVLTRKNFENLCKDLFAETYRLLNLTVDFVN